MSERREWQSFHIYSSEIDRLLVEVVEPALSRHLPPGHRAFWERHYLGGAHLRVRIHCERGDLVLAAQCDAVRHACEGWVSEHPSPRGTSYSAEATAKLLVWENLTATTEELTYRVNTVETVVYSGASRGLASVEAEELVEDFLCDARPLAMQLIGAEDKLALALQLYWLEALHIDSRPTHGAISFKSHWETFATFFEHQPFVDLVERHFQQKMALLTEMLEQTIAWNNTINVPTSPPLMMWKKLMETYDGRVEAGLRLGHIYTRQMDTAEEVNRGLESNRARSLRPSRFMEALYGDPAFLTSFGSEARLIVPRILVNLLYNLVSLANITMLERQSLCYFAHRTIEESYHVDLTDLFCSLNQIEPPVADMLVAEDGVSTTKLAH